MRPLPVHLYSPELDTSYPSNQIRYKGDSDEILEVRFDDISEVKKQVTRELFQDRLSSIHAPYASGVWRFHELVLPIEENYIYTKIEGNTNLYATGRMVPTGLKTLGEYVGSDHLYLKHEGENPTGSFKDRGMAVGVSIAKRFGANAVACASTGNTSASLAAYAALAGMKCFVFIPEGNIAVGKLSQALAYGATTIQIKGDFDDAMLLVQTICEEMNIYLLNSINPFRIEGQKSIGFEIIQQLDWNVPDWIVIPAGNLGNTTAIGKAMRELHQVGLIDKIPRIASIQPEGSNPFYRSFQENFATRHTVKANTIATAIKIGNPVSYHRAKKIIQDSKGIVEQVSDQQILDAKAHIDSIGIGCEPGSATSVAGIKKLIENNIIKPEENVVAILTGNILKDPDTTIGYHMKTLPGFEYSYANEIISTNGETNDVKKVLEKYT